MSVFIKETWAGFHEVQDKGALTGTSFDGLVTYFDLGPIIRKDLHVLEIGVGFGHCIRGFYAAGCIVSALDICEEAFDGLHEILTKEYLHESVEQLPSGVFDLAVSLLVTQHMSDPDILKQFPHVLRSLKDDGTFIVQFAGSDIASENNCPDIIPGEPCDGKVSMLGGRMVRTADYAEHLVQQSGGRVVRIGGHRRFPKYRSYWYWLAIQKDVPLTGAGGKA